MCERFEDSLISSLLNSLCFLLFEDRETGRCNGQLGIRGGTSKYSRTSNHHRSSSIIHCFINCHTKIVDDLFIVILCDSTVRGKSILLRLCS